MYVYSAVPNKQSLGATNGLTQTVVSIQRAVGPAAALLFALTIKSDILIFHVYGTARRCVW